MYGVESEDNIVGISNDLDNYINRLPELKQSHGAITKNNEIVSIYKEIVGLTSYSEEDYWKNVTPGEVNVLSGYMYFDNGASTYIIYREEGRYLYIGNCYFIVSEKLGELLSKTLS